MSKPFGSIIPQRYYPSKGWRAVEATSATSWLAIPTKGSVARYAKRQAAVEHLARAERLASPQRRFAFGSRCPKPLRREFLVAESSTPRKDESHD
jgi:hypothetical protein